MIVIIVMIMEKKMETTLVYRGYLGVMDKGHGNYYNGLWSRECRSSTVSMSGGTARGCRVIGLGVQELKGLRSTRQLIPEKILDCRLLRGFFLSWGLLGAQRICGKDGSWSAKTKPSGIMLETMMRHFHVQGLRQSCKKGLQVVAWIWA